MLKKIHIGKWHLEVDTTSTRDVYERTLRGSPAACGCTICRNFAALGDAAFPSDFRDEAESLGIDPHKAAEIHEWFGFRDSHLNYGGWFHCIGRVLSGPADSDWGTSVDDWPWHNLTDSFKIVVDSRRDLAFDEFEDQPLVRVEFYAREAWVLSEPYPG